MRTLRLITLALVAALVGCLEGPKEPSRAARDGIAFRTLRAEAVKRCEPRSTWEECFARIEPVAPIPKKPAALATRMWPHALELCEKKVPWLDCLKLLRANNSARQSGSVDDLQAAADLLCDADDDWQECFERLEPAPAAAPESKPD